MDPDADDYEQNFRLIADTKLMPQKKKYPTRNLSETPPVPPPRPDLQPPTTRLGPPPPAPRPVDAPPPVPAPRPPVDQPPSSKTKQTPATQASRGVIRGRGQRPSICKRPSKEKPPRKVRYQCSWFPLQMSKVQVV